MLVAEGGVAEYRYNVSCEQFHGFFLSFMRFLGCVSFIDRVSRHL